MKRKCHRVCGSRFESWHLVSPIGPPLSCYALLSYFTWGHQPSWLQTQVCSLSLPHPNTQSLSLSSTQYLLLCYLNLVWSWEDLSLAPPRRSATERPPPWEPNTAIPGTPSPPSFCAALSVRVNNSWDGLLIISPPPERIVWSAVLSVRPPARLFAVDELG